MEEIKLIRLDSVNSTELIPLVMKGAAEVSERLGFYPKHPDLQEDRTKLFSGIQVDGLDLAKTG